MSASTWRNAAREVIQSVIDDNPTVPEVVLEAKIRDAYPFGERTNHPYKIWLEEVRNTINYRAKLATLGMTPNEVNK